MTMTMRRITITMPLTNDNDDKHSSQKPLITGSPTAPPWYRARGYDTQASYDYDHHYDLHKYTRSIN